MSQKAKLLRKVKELKEISFSEAAGLLRDAGFVHVTVKGSHHTFRNSTGPQITLVFRNPIHRDAVRELRNLLEL